MIHEVLGEVDETDCRPFDGVATVPFGSSGIQIRIVCDDQPFQVPLELAAEVVRRLPELDQLAKRVAVRDLRQTYNEGWKDYNEVQEDGSLKEVINAQLSETELEAKLSLEAVTVTGCEMVDFYYDDENMFWGHSVVVTSTDGVDLTRARAEFFG